MIRRNNKCPRTFAASRRFAILLGATLITIAFANPARADDELTKRERRLLAGLVERGMPELVEKMIAGRSNMLIIHVAHAADRAAAQEPDEATKSKLIKHAVASYRSAIAAAERAMEKEGEKGRFVVAQWKIELADLLLRRVVGPELDRYEITSGLGFDPRTAIAALSDTAAAYEAAGEILHDMDLRARVDADETYLLFGITGKLGALLERQRLNGAWCSLYQAMLSPPSATERETWLADARSRFDATAQDASDTSIKYNAQLGYGIALRESRRFDEALDYFGRVAQSTQPPGVTSRAQYEMARCFIADGRFDAARLALEELASEPADADAAFYVRLGPLVHAYTFIAEAARMPHNSPPRMELEKRAEMELVKLARQGGPWPEMVQVYLHQIAGAERDLSDLSTVELGIAAGRWMSEREFERALEAWESLLKRDPAPEERHLARFNKAVCLFQLGRLRDAATIFIEEARRPAEQVQAPKTYDYAYRTWKQLAAESQSPDDYMTLAEAARLLYQRLPKDAAAQEAVWVAALSLEQTGRYEMAIEAYNEIAESSENFWEAQRNAARCRQRAYEALSAKSTIVEKQRMARAAIDVWKFLAERIESELRAMRDGRAVQKAGAPDRKSLRRWRRDALVAAGAILAGDDLRDFDGCLALIEDIEPDARQLGLRIRCYQALGRAADANRALEAFARSGVDADLGGVLISLAADMQAEIEKLRSYGRREDARQLAEQTAPTIRYLIEWLKQQPQHQKHVPIAQLALIDTLQAAGKPDEARTMLDELIAGDPTNGTFLRRGARLREQLAEVATGTAASTLRDEAEALWGRLLMDATLKANAPAVYWEARYHWLSHQLRHGRATEVVAGIESERAWQPNLGGPPWQGRLLELLAKAERAAESQRNQTATGA